MSKKKDKDALKLHDKCMKKYFDEKKKVKKRWKL